MKRKLKTIKQLLEEFPGAEFEEDGCLYCKEWGDFMDPAMFKNLGKEIDFIDDSFENFRYIEQWFEPLPEKKKVCAFTDSSGNLRWTVENSERMDIYLKMNDYTRAPEFDIEAKE